MERVKKDNKLNVVIGTKAQIDGDAGIPENSIIIATDEELKADEIAYSDEDERNVKEVIDDKQDKLKDSDSITIDENNVISASIAWEDVENKPELYERTEIDEMFDNLLGGEY